MANNQNDRNQGGNTGGQGGNKEQGDTSKRALGSNETEDQREITSEGGKGSAEARREESGSESGSENRTGGNSGSGSGNSGGGSRSGGSGSGSSNR